MSERETANKKGFKIVIKILKQCVWSKTLSLKRYIDNAFHPNVNVHRLYLKRGKGELELISVRECINIERKTWQSIWLTASKNCHSMLLMQKDLTKVDLRVLVNFDQK